MKRHYVLPNNVHDTEAGMPEYCMFYDAAEVDAFMSVAGLTKLTDRIDELQKQVATLERSNSRLRQKIDRLSS